MLKLFGAILIIASSAGIGFSAAESEKKRYRTLCAVCDVLEHMSMQLEYEAPTVEELILQASDFGDNVPQFIKKCVSADGLTEIIAENPDGLDECDINKLTALFSQLGSSDKLCEQQRLASACAYFQMRCREEREPTAKRAKLYSSLGILGGIFAVVLLI